MSPPPSGEHALTRAREVIQDVLPRVIEREEAIEQELAQAKKAIDGARVAAEADSRDLMRNLSAHLESMEGAIARKGVGCIPRGGGSAPGARSLSRSRVRLSPDRGATQRGCWGSSGPRSAPM